MQSEKIAKLIVTLGPATKTEQDLRRVKDKGADFVRINMSHSTLDDLRYFINLAKKVGIPFIVDTEGSQIRTGELPGEGTHLEETDEIRIYNKPILGGEKEFHLRPEGVVDEMEEGDLIYIDFDALILKVSDSSTKASGFVTAKALTGGVLRKNKAVVVDWATGKTYNLPPLSEKDYGSIKLGLENGIEYIAASFMRSGEFVEEVRRAAQGRMKIISKIECIDALEHLDEIMRKSDYLLLDRGDLSKEVPIERIPLAQKMIISRAARLGKGVFVATNFLESMVKNPRPTRAEVSDVVNTILDGAYGLALSSETAIGKYPFKAINMMNKLIQQAEFAQGLQNMSVLYRPVHQKPISTSDLVPPHGGKLVDRVLRSMPDENNLNTLPRVQLNENLQMDVEQIAIGTFSPLQGFMNREDLQSVLDDARLTSGVIWPLPLVLDVTGNQAETIGIGDDIALTQDEDEIMAIMHVEDKYSFDLEEMALKLYGTLDATHPGVAMVKNMNPFFLGGKIDLIKRKKSEFKEYELTPRQVRRLFDERGWSKVVGFHTRNVIHRGHEYIQLSAMQSASCDGLFVHPVVGKKKPGDFNAKYIIRAYEMMIRKFYPKDSVLFGAFATYSRYAGPREALFTAICRQNFGCSHFVIGRDHTGVKDFYSPTASHEIFDRFPDLGIKPVKFNKVFYSRKLNTHVHEADAPEHPEEDKLHISGTEARAMLEKGELPPEWYMRPEIAKLITDGINNGEEVFVK